MDFALGQFDLMEKIGQEVKYIRETNANKEKFVEVISNVEIFEELRTRDYSDFHQDILRTPTEEEDFIEFLKYCMEFPYDEVIDIFIDCEQSTHWKEIDFIG
ncbi:MAG: hypothetical protein CL525_12515 [Aequorivita sp.]|nr:hypothetical protein [Aequorivita sp.]|tara:strand:+ start:113 stop:418 length:306 start_codon:yes stop_codon:yes gene_type:complete